jgi:ferric-dicitrate binding protein FerR (iron transport regulator)
VRCRELGAKQLGPAFDGWFAKAVNREASQRFANAGQAEAALLPILAALPDSEPAPTTSPGRRRWLPLLLLAGLLLILGLFGLSRLID